MRLFLVCFLFHVCAVAQVRLPRLVRDSMILQRDVPLRLWGWASPSEKVTVVFNGKRFKTHSSAEGKWAVMMPAMQVGGPYTIRINEITLREVLIGDVWICAGQSNMVHQMALHKERYAEDIASADYPEIREFRVPDRGAIHDSLGTIRDDLQTGFWKSATASDIGDFSAVGYFFARNIYRQYHVPIGLINASVGGTPIEAWTPDADVHVSNNVSNAVIPDVGLISRPAWYETSYVPKHWRPVNVPGYWQDQGADLNGTVWYRREIDVPAAMTGKPAKLSLGRIVDADVVYVNGFKAGSTGYQYPQRRYMLPAGVLKAGKNLIVVCVSNYTGKGGFVPDKPYYLSVGSDTIDLKGTWSYKVGGVVNDAVITKMSSNPGVLYNTMIAPLTSYAIKGVLWYQGESNADHPESYEKLLQTLIKDWRNQWQQGDIPFLYVQLPNFMDVKYLPSASNWAVIREAQRKALMLHNTGMAVTIDLGEWNDIHPDKKKEVGERLALLARKIAYKESSLVATGPLYEKAVADGNRIILSFSTAVITNDGEAPAQFAIAGADKKFVWANARIEGNTVVVWSDAVTSPKYIRYAWADNPDNPNLYTREGLPASPFETYIQ